ncbi:protection of telomeres protein 1b isoform X2 [Actinidia eriantha]|uniref:protection of telomeres protein 1b isoform X2 n=1 Tax=Actinidia eriantha TaxID=165200 RepID=UPI0025872479|nr:protection of telomeres protein 1b isoform X2 [Actinidia eriantha]
MGCREDDYRFLQIVDAMASINQRVNLIGLVVETSIPKHSKGTDCFCSVKIVDESYSSPGISVNLFSENMEKLPHVESAGDIIQLSHVVMKTHGREIYALFNKKFSSFALFEGKYSTNFTPYQVSQNFRPRDQDKKFIAGLRKWSANYQLNTGTDESLSLKEIRVGEGLNLMCKVLHTCKVTKSEWMIFVWDGTDTPPVTVHTKYYDERVSSKWARMPSSSFPWSSHITETDYEDVPFVTLMNVLTYPEVTAKFRCVVRVIAALPWGANEFRSQLGTYRIRLTLEDPTARIHAFVYAEDGEEFFGGYPSLDVMKRKRNKLLGITESDNSAESKDVPRNPPWVQCCLKSYYLDKRDVWGSRSYRIFATKVVE